MLLKLHSSGLWNFMEQFSFAELSSSFSFSSPLLLSRYIDIIQLGHSMFYEVSWWSICGLLQHSFVAVVVDVDGVAIAVTTNMVSQT